MQYLGAILKMTERSRFISKVKYSTSQIQDYAPTTDAKELKLNGSMKTYKTF